MDTDEALRLTRSQVWSDRANAGRHLSAVAGQEPVDAAVRDLLLDRGDTAVTEATAEALLRRGDAPALRLLAAVWHVAAPQTADHLGAALSRVLFELSCADLRSRLRFLAAVEGLLAESDPDVRADARDLLDEVAQALLD
ncbi:hypothetical protein [Polymorphospora sp. NPDC050346]|uniref:hypothetical protein n=1 Tax=Polymorphospora sp. NPDC050346 TaxID=3155780 RepID=UPI0033F733E8